MVARNSFERLDTRLSGLGRQALGASGKFSGGSDRKYLCTERMADVVTFNKMRIRFSPASPGPDGQTGDADLDSLESPDAVDDSICREENCLPISTSPHCSHTFATS